MLAEPRRKQKWSLNPRGKDWTLDTNKFGQKMLEKMGWSQGKGLGAKEDGRTEHIKVNYKNDAKGMGYKESDSQWTQHESQFSALLEALGSSGQIDELKLSSLEEKSQNSRARVHYKKFTRGKDLSRYSEKDLANIFGRKKLKTTVKEEIERPSEVEHNKDSTLFSNAGSMSDYFKKKLPSFGKVNGYSIGNNGVLKKDDSESESELRPVFGFGFNNNVESNTASYKPNFVSYISEDQTTIMSKKKKGKREKEEKHDLSETSNKRKKHDFDVSNSAIDKSNFVSNIAENQDTISSKKQKDKKKQLVEESILMETSCNQQGSELESELKASFVLGFNNFIDNMSDPTTHTFIDKRKKKDKKKRVLEDDLVNVSTKKYKQDNEISLKKKTKSKKKKKEDENGLFNPGFDPLYSPINIERSTLELIEETFNESRVSNNSISSQNVERFEVSVQVHKNENFDDSLQFDKSSLNETIENGEISKKKKRKEKNGKTISPIKEQKGNDNGLDNPVFNMNVENKNLQICSSDVFGNEIKKKKKKSKKEKENCGLENPVFSETDTSFSNGKVNGEFEVERKKSKKKKQQEGLDNPALNLNDIDENCDIMLNVVTTPIINTEQRTRESISVKRVSDVRRRKSVRFSDVTRERIIPNKDDLNELNVFDISGDVVEIQGKLNDSFLTNPKKLKKQRKGLDNEAFDMEANKIEENIASISETLDSYEAEIENDMNEKKLKTVELDEVMVGEVGNPDGDNEVLEDGTVKLKFKHVDFKRQSMYTTALTGPKKSYKHLIKGDIIVGFKHTNLHEISGYALKKRK